MKAYIVTSNWGSGEFKPMWAYDNLEEAWKDVAKDDDREIVVVNFYPNNLKKLIEER